MWPVSSSTASSTSSGEAKPSLRRPARSSARLIPSCGERVVEDDAPGDELARLTPQHLPQPRRPCAGLRDQAMQGQDGHEEDDGVGHALSEERRLQHHRELDEHHEVEGGGLPGQPLAGQAHDEHEADVVQDGVERLAGEVGGHLHQYDT